MLSLPVSPGASRFGATPFGLPAGAGNLPVFYETQTKNMHFAGRSWKIVRIVTFQFMNFTSAQMRVRSVTHRSEHCSILSGFQNGRLYDWYYYSRYAFTLVVALHNANHRETVENVFDYLPTV